MKRAIWISWKSARSIEPMATSVVARGYLVFIYIHEVVHHILVRRSPADFLRASSYVGITS